MSHDPSPQTHTHPATAKKGRLAGLFATLAPHSLCCGLPVVAALAGVSVIDAHNPALEYSLAVIAPIVGKAFHDHLWPRIRRSHHCVHDHQPLMTRLRDYGLLVSFSVALMAGHQYFFHDSHQTSPAHGQEQHTLPP